MAFEMCPEEWGGLSGGHRGEEAESHLRSEPSQSVRACVVRRWDQLDLMFAHCRRPPMPGQSIYI